MIELVKEHTGFKVVNRLFNQVSLFVDVADITSHRSFDHASNAWKRETVLPLVLVFDARSVQLGVDEDVEVTRVEKALKRDAQTLIKNRHFFLSLISIWVEPHTILDMLMDDKGRLRDADLACRQGVAS